MKDPECSWFEATSIADELDLIVAHIDARIWGFTHRNGVRDLIAERSRTYRLHATHMKGRNPQ